MINFVIVRRVRLTLGSKEFPVNIFMNFDNKFRKKTEIRKGKKFVTGILVIYNEGFLFFYFDTLVLTCFGRVRVEVQT